MNQLTRRHFVALSSSALAATLAGCGGGSDDDDSGDSGGTATPEGSELQGYTDEDQEVVDLQYRDYTDSEVEAVRSDAESISYDDLFRNIEDHTGDYVTFQAEIIQFADADEYTAVLFQFGSVDDVAYGSWIGDRFLRGDVVTAWAEVLGTETYQTGSGSQLTVPALSIADMELESTEEE